MNKPPREIDIWLKDHLFNVVPMSIAVIDQQFNLVYANNAFEQMFGTWKGRKCYEVYKEADGICPHCKGAEAFQNGIPVVNEEVGYDRRGRLTRYIKHTVPVTDEQGRIPYLIEMSTDVTETEQIRREYQLLFDQVPCSILIIDRDYRIVKTNARARKMLGNLEGRHCFKGLKGFDHKCAECTARQTFADGRLHTGHHIWRTRDGRTIHQHVSTVPLRLDNGTFDMVMEMAVDVTQTLKLEDNLKFAHLFLETMISTSMDGIFAIDAEGHLSVFNPAARRMFGLSEKEQVTREQLDRMLPAHLIDRIGAGERQIYLPDTCITNVEGSDVPVRLTGNQLKFDGRVMGMAFSVQDLSGIKKLEKEKLEAERLAAVGQTVAGLAHGIKNLTTALEGGLYMLNTGVQKGNLDRLQKGLEMLDRNIERISMFVRAFLSFAKGRQIHAQINDPATIAREVVEMFAPKAEELGIELRFEQTAPLAPAAIDYESMHECLTNLVGNAIDACRVSTSDGSHVVVRACEENGTIIYEVVDDGCGMDYEVKKKVFTTFFTTKGLGGTGLGLLMTKKIIHEHGGQISLESEPNKGTVFRIHLPRERLPQPAEDGEKEIEDSRRQK